MPNDAKVLREIQDRIDSRDYSFTLHATERIIQRRILVSGIERASVDGKAEIIEYYPDDPRGPSCLILGFTGNGMPLHIQCTYPPRVVVVTAYEPEPAEWTNWRTRT